MSERKSPSIVLLLGLALALAATKTSRADTVVLRDGTAYEGEIVRESHDNLTLCVQWGGLKGSVVIPKAEIASLQRGPLRPDPVLVEAQALEKAAEAAAAEARAGESRPRAASKAAEAWVTLGECYGRHYGYSAQARKAFEKALLCNSDHPIARDRLGFVKSKNGWVEKRRPGPPPVEFTIGLRQDDLAAHAQQAAEARAAARQLAEEETQQRAATESARRPAQIADSSAFCRSRASSDRWYSDGWRCDGWYSGEWAFRSPYLIEPSPWVHYYPPQRQPCRSYYQPGCWYQAPHYPVYAPFIPSYWGSGGWGWGGWGVGFRGRWGSTSFNGFIFNGGGRRRF